VNKASRDQVELYHHWNDPTPPRQRQRADRDEALQLLASPTGATSNRLAIWLRRMDGLRQELGQYAG